jgi:outer membrane immunogenic protein
MKKFLFAGIALAALSGAPAIAAEMPLKADPLFNWTGWYLGVNGGYSWGRSRATINDGTTTFTQSIKHDGAEGSGEGGYCWQTRGDTRVICLELRYDFPRERGRGTIDIPGVTITPTPEIDPFLIGPHFGFLTDMNRTMWYLAGGLATGPVGGSASATGPGGSSTANAGHKWSAGWFVGAGIERMIDQHWSWKFEYDYVRFENGNGASALFSQPGPRALPAGSTASIAGGAYDNVVTVGINYHFGTR